MPYAHLVNPQNGLLLPRGERLRSSSSNNNNSSSNNNSSNVNLYKASLLRAHCIGALLWGIGLRFAGSNDPAALLLLLQYYATFACMHVAAAEPSPLQEEVQQQQQRQQPLVWVPSLPIRCPQLQQQVGLDAAAAAAVLRCCCCALACVAAGTGRKDVFAVLLRERHRLSSGSSSSSSNLKGYAEQLLLHHCVGLLFMGGCRWSLQRSSNLHDVFSLR